MSSIAAIEKPTNPQQAQGPDDSAPTQGAPTEFYVLPPATKSTVTATSPHLALSPHAESQASNSLPPPSQAPAATPAKAPDTLNSFLQGLATGLYAAGLFVGNILLLGGSCAVISCIGLAISGNPATLTVLAFGGAAFGIGALLALFFSIVRRP